MANNRLFDANVTYKWHLDDPSAPGNSTFAGNGTVTVPGRSGHNVSIAIPPDQHDQRDYAMDVELLDGNMSVYHYTEQKSVIDWDYGTLPPRPRSGILYYVFGIFR